MIWTLRPQLGGMVERMIHGAYQQSILPAEERESLAMVLDSFRAFAADTIDSHKLDQEGKFPDAVRAVSLLARS